MIYLDNAATSYPKPPQVIRAMAGTLEKLGANPGRGGHRLAVCAGRVVQRCREELAELAGRCMEFAFERHTFRSLEILEVMEV